MKNVHLHCYYDVNLFYITNDHKLKEISYDANYKPVVSGLNEAEDTDNDLVSDDEIVEENEDLNEMFNQEDTALEKENENGKEKENKQLVRKIRKYINYLKENTNYKTDFYELGDGIAISIKK